MDSSGHETQLELNSQVKFSKFPLLVLLMSKLVQLSWCQLNATKLKSHWIHEVGLYRNDFCHCVFLILDQNKRDGFATSYMERRRTDGVTHLIHQMVSEIFSTIGHLK